MTKLTIALLAALLPGSALAAPAFLPMHDVTVRYSLEAPGQAPQDYVLSYNAAQQLARVDSPSGFYVLADLPTGQAQAVVPALHAIVQAPDFSSLTDEIFHADGARFTLLGHDHYAGLGCDTYLVQSRDGTAQACLTRDGVILHFAGTNAQGRAEVTALSVQPGPQPPGTFDPPPGFTPLNLPPGALAALLRSP